MSLVWENVAVMVRIILAYSLIYLLLPSVILRDFVADRDIGYRAIFYQTAMNLYVIAVSFLLSFTYSYSALHMWLLVVGLPLAVHAVRRRKKLREMLKSFLKTLQDLRTGLMSYRQFFRAVGNRLKGALDYAWREWIRGRVMTIIACAALGAFIIGFYGYFKLTHSTYAFTDEETHLSWTQGVLHNAAFPTGMYPHGLHFLAASLISMFGLPVARAWLCFNFLTDLLIFWFAFMFLRVMFPAKPAAIAAVGIQLIGNIFSMTTYYRYQMIIPMEFSMAGVFAFFYGVVCFIRDRSNRSLVLLAMGFVWSFEVHFYGTIYAAFLTVVFGAVFLKRLLQEKLLLKLVITAVLALVVAITPFLIGLGFGFTFERSIAWALDVTLDTNLDTYGDSDEEEEEEEEEESEEEKQIREDLESIHSVWDALDYYAESLASRTTYSPWYSWLLTALLGFLLLWGGVGRWLVRKKDREKQVQFELYLFAAGGWIISLIIIMMPFLLLPEIIQGVRASIFSALFALTLLAAPVQAVCDLLELLPGKKRHLAAVELALTITGLTAFWKFGETKVFSELYYEFAMEDADGWICMDCMENRENWTWTVVSLTNDLSIIKYNGYHYEIIDLLEEVDAGQEKTFIPTSLVYIVCEKRVINYGYAERRQVDGSDFMAKTIRLTSAQADLSLTELGINYLSTRDRAYYELRLQTMSKLFFLCEKLMVIYPGQVDVYYEDDYCRIYRIQQDSYFLLNLSVDYSDMIARGTDFLYPELAES